MAVAVSVLYAALIVMIAFALAVTISRVIFARKIPLFVLLFLILPVGQLLTLYSFNFEQWSLYLLAGMLLGTGADALLLICAVSQEKKTDAEEELKETRHMTELERSHYETIDRRREELAKIRRDFNRQLEIVAGFARSGEDDAARAMIAALAEKIDGTKEKPYCDIPVINAILMEKARESAAAGIELTVDLKLPPGLAVEPMHLCSIFGNLLDNAIAACKTPTPRDANKARIRLSALADGDYLFIKTVNPAEAPGKKVPPGRGYGTRILSELASRYGGAYLTEYKDGAFTALISLPAAESAAEAR